MRHGAMLIFLTIAILAQANSAWAEAVTMKHKGRDGTWVDAETMKQIRRDLEDGDRCEMEILPSRRLLDLRLRRIQELELAIDHSVKAMGSYDLSLDHLRGALDQAERDRDRAQSRVIKLEAKYSKWYRSPVFWVSSGLVLGALGFAVGAAAI